jgi:hypothetical protein
MSEEVDTVALAALARSNSRAICVSMLYCHSSDFTCCRYRSANSSQYALHSALESVFRYQLQR